MIGFKPEDLPPFKLSAGTHPSPSSGMCVMEMASFLAGEEWSDHPKCVSPVVASFCRIINDQMPQEYRNKLQLRIFKMMRTNNDVFDQQRAEFLVWQAITVFTPSALASVGLKDQAEKLRYFDKTLGLELAAKAVDAADAAAKAVDAADAAAYAAYAAYAADAAAKAAKASGDGVWGLVLTCLDGLLEIGVEKEPPKINWSQKLNGLRETVAAGAGE